MPRHPHAAGAVLLQLHDEGVVPESKTQSKYNVSLHALANHTLHTHTQRYMKTIENTHKHTNKQKNAYNILIHIVQLAMLYCTIVYSLISLENEGN